MAKSSPTTPPSPTSSSSQAPKGLRTAHAARKRYIERLQLSLSCVSGTIWRYSEPGGDGKQPLFTNELVLNLPMVGSRRHRHLKATQAFHVVDIPEIGGYRVRTDAYAYTVSDSSALKPELFAWHWNPEHGTRPHVHVRRYDPQHGDLAKLHVPTGRVLFEDVVRFLIEELGVKPLRSDWEAILDEVAAGVKNVWSWS